MKILKRTKGILRFRTPIGNITLTDDNKGITELSNEEFKAMKDHPMFDAIVKTNGISVLAEEKEDGLDVTIDVPSIPEYRDEKVYDLNEINLEIQSKVDLILIAKSLDIETKNLTKPQLIEAIQTKKKELDKEAEVNVENNEEDKGN